MIRHNVQQLTGAFLADSEKHPSRYKFALDGSWNRYKQRWEHSLLVKELENHAAAFVARSEMAALWLVAVCYNQVNDDGFRVDGMYFADGWPSSNTLMFFAVTSITQNSLGYSLAAVVWSPSELYKAFDPSFHIKFI